MYFFIFNFYRLLNYGEKVITHKKKSQMSLSLNPSFLHSNDIYVKK